MTKVYKPKVCKVCKETFTPERQFQGTCTFACAIEHGRVKAKDNVKKDKRKAVKAFNQTDTKWLTKEAQKVFNKYIRKRDEKECCISCGYRFTYLDSEKCEEGRQRQAGHLRTEQKHSALRFNEDNVWAQCNHCNDPFYGLKGNVAEYEKRLREKIGDARVDAMFRAVSAKKWTIEELQDIIDTYKQKIKGM